MSTKGNIEEHTQYFRPELSCQLQYWGYNGTASVEGTNKTKLMKIHPLFPWILTCDEEELITVWNYESQEKLISQPVYALVSESETRKSISMHPEIQLELHRSLNRYDNDYILADTLSIPPPKRTIPNAAKYREIYGQVRDLDFVDESTLTYNGGADGTDSSTSQSHDYQIFIQLDQAVVVVRLMTKRVTIINQQLLGKLPTSVDFLSPNYCLIGCTDGLVRVWDLAQNKVEKTLPVGRGEIAAVKVLPFESPVDDYSNIQKIRVFTLGADGTGLIWSLSLQQSNLLGGVETPIAKLNEPINQKLHPQSVLVDRENQQLIIRVTDHKFNVYDLQDLHSLSMMSNKESKRLSSTNRRGSLLPFKLGGGGSSSSINTTNDESIPLLKCHAILKIEKALQQRIPKVYSFTMMKHSSFLSNVYAVTPKTSMIMLVHTAAAGGGDDSEQASAITTANEKQRLTLMLEINVQKYLNDYYAKHSNGGTLHLTEPLKIYSIQTGILNPQLLILATSYGPMVLTLPYLPNGPFIGYHPLWKDNILTTLENYVKRVSFDLTRYHQSSDTNENHSTLSPPDLEGDVISEFKYEKNSSTGGDGKSPPVTDKKPVPSKGLVALPTGPNPFKEDKPIYYSSPSGDYCCVYWPQSCCYSLLYIPPTPIFTNTETNGEEGSNRSTLPRDNSLRRRSGGVGHHQNVFLQEVERGYCLEFAWIGMDNTYIVKTPMGQKTVVNAEKAKRTITSSLFGKQEKTSKKMVFNELLMKRIQYTTSHLVNQLPIKSIEIPNPDYQPGEVNPTATTTSGSAPPAPSIPPIISLDVKQVVDLFSGPLLSINYQLSSHTNMKMITNAEEIPTIEAKSSLLEVYHQFFYYHPEQQKLLPVGPILPRILSIKWDYYHYFGAFQNVDGTITVVRLSFDTASGETSSSSTNWQSKIQLQTVATLHYQSFSSIPKNPTHGYFWDQGLLWTQSYPILNYDQNLINPWTIYSFWKVPTSQVQILMNPQEQKNPKKEYFLMQKINLSLVGKKSNDWKRISNIFHGDFLGVSEGYLTLCGRDGLIKTMGLSQYPLLVSFILFHEYCETIQRDSNDMTADSTLQLFIQSLQGLSSNEQLEVARWLEARGMKTLIWKLPHCAITY